VGVRIVVITPSADSGLEFGRIFVGQDSFFGAAAVFECIEAGFGFAVRGARAGGSGRVGGRELVERIAHGCFRADCGGAECEACARNPGKRLIRSEMEAFSEL
jgi:hypothetical protein